MREIIIRMILSNLLSIEVSTINNNGTINERRINMEDKWFVEGIMDREMVEKSKPHTNNAIKALISAQRARAL